MTRRMFDSRVWTNDRFGQMPIMARLLLLGIINLADDQGRLMAHPVYLRSQVFPYDDVAIDDIRKWLKLIAQNGTIAIYQADGKDYIQLLNWWEYQSLQYPAPSEYPAQPGWQDRIRYNAKGGTVLTYNWITIKGERLPDTCDSHGNLLGYSVEQPPTIPLEAPPETPSGNPSETPLEAPIQLEDQDQQQQGDDEDDDTQARDPVHAAWFETYQEEMPPKIEKVTPPLVTECGEAAVIHGIRESVNAASRSFKFIAECARNYIPPPPSNNGTGSYHVDLPDAAGEAFSPAIHPLTYLPYAPKPTALPPPMPHDDPWAVCLAELEPTLPGVAVSYLKGSALYDAGDVDGVPLYRVVVEERAAAGLSWLIAQAGPAIRRKLGGVLARPVLIEIVAAQAETEPT